MPVKSPFVVANFNCFEGTVMNYLVCLIYIIPDEKQKLNNRDYYRTNPNPNAKPR